MINYLVKLAIEEESISEKEIEKIIKNPKYLRKFRNSVEQAKKELSNSHQCQIEISAGDLEISSTINRATFEEICNPLFLRVNEVIKMALNKANININQIDEVVCVGGSSRIPKIIENLK